jgi:hypothetical protein
MSLAFKSKKGISRSLSTLRYVLADRVYRGMQFVNALSLCVPWTTEIVKRPPGVKATAAKFLDEARSYCAT